MRTRLAWAWVRGGIQPLTFFKEEERCRKLVELVRAWSLRYPTPHATAHSVADAQLAGAPNYGRDDKAADRDGFDKIYEVCWLNVFGPKLVETVGRDRMLSTPAHRLEELPNGSVLLVTWPTAADFTHPEARRAQARALVHLRPELDFDTVLRGLHERTTALVPVEPRFHPDVAPLLGESQKTCPTARPGRKERDLGEPRMGPAGSRPWPVGERDGRRGRTHQPMGGPVPSRGARDLRAPSVSLWPEPPEPAALPLVT